MKLPVFKKRKNPIYEMVEDYLVQMEKCIELFKTATDIYFKEGISREFFNMIEKTHVSESRADDTRRRIVLSFYEKSLIPESRADMLELIELTDRVFNKAQSVLYQAETQDMVIPVELKDDFKSLIECNISAYKSSIEGFKNLFIDVRRIKESVEIVDSKESSSDRQERSLIRKIFAANIDMAYKILLKELTLEIGKISDLSEEVTDKLNIVAVKRMF